MKATIEFKITEASVTMTMTTNDGKPPTSFSGTPQRLREIIDAGGLDQLKEFADPKEWERLIADLRNATDGQEIGSVQP